MAATTLRTSQESLKLQMIARSSTSSSQGAGGEGGPTAGAGRLPLQRARVRAVVGRAPQLSQGSAAAAVDPAEGNSSGPAAGWSFATNRKASVNANARAKAAPPRREKSFDADQLRSIFNEFDADGSGAIDAGELRAAVGRYGVEISTAEAVAMLAEADDDGDGEVGFDEFQNILSRAQDLVQWKQLRGSVITGNSGRARSVSVAAEMGATVKRLRTANDSDDVSEMQAAIAAARELQARTVGTSAAAELQSLIVATTRRLSAELSEEAQLRGSQRVRAVVRRLWELMVVE
jgi:hypothetical protein